MSQKHSLPRELKPNVFWLGQCQEQRTRGKVYHGYNSAFLVAGSHASCLIDTGAPKDFVAVAGQIEELLARGLPPLKYLFPTHQETPHSGGLGRFLTRYPEATLHGDVSDYHLAFPEHAHRLRSMIEGDAIDLGGRKLMAVEPIVRDLRTTLWVFDTQDHVLFPADGFAYSHYHFEGHCGLLAEEAKNLDLKDVSAVYSERALYWTKFVDMNLYIRELRRLLKELDVRFIAPTHGLPIGDLELTVPRLEEGLLYASEAELTPVGDLAQQRLREGIVSGVKNDDAVEAETSRVG